MKVFIVHVPILGEIWQLKGGAEWKMKHSLEGS